MYLGYNNNLKSNLKIKLKENYSNINYGILPKYKQLYFLNNINKPKEYNEIKALLFLEDLNKYNSTFESFNKITLYLDETLQKYPIIPDYRHALVVLERDLLEISHLIVETNISNNDFLISIKKFLEQEKINKNSKELLKYYLDSMEITRDIVTYFRNILNNIKNKEIYSEYSKIFEFYFEEIF
jgi:hypothetical protein